MERYFFTTVFIGGIFLVAVYFAKPICKSGYIPVFVITDGWSCAPGYKP